MRKNLKTILLLLAVMAAMCIFAGCGDGKQDDSALTPELDKQTAEQLPDTTGMSNDEEQADSEEQENDAEDGQDGGVQDQPEGESLGDPSNAPASDASGTSTGETDELSVDVESVGDNSVVGNKIFIESGIDGNSEIMTVGVGEDNQVLVAVYFAPNASYVYKTIRNGGADVETRDGSFSDIKEGLTLHLTGYYQSEDFYADKVVISNVIID